MLEGIKVGPACEGSANADMRAGGGCCDARGGFVFAYIACCQPCNDDRLNAGVREPFEVGSCKNATLAEVQRTHADGMRENSAFGFRYGRRFEFHPWRLGGESLSRQTQAHPEALRSIPIFKEHLSAVSFRDRLDQRES